VAELFQTEWNEIKTRQGAQDLQTLIQLIDRDGSIEIVEDPSPEEILKAREQAAKDAEKQQAEAEKKAEKEAKEAEEEAEEFDAEADKTARAAALPVPEDSETAIDETYGDAAADTAEAKQKKDDKKATGR